MAKQNKIGDLCDVCNRVIKSYPIYGPGTCHVCQYEKYIEKNMPELKSKINDFFKKRVEDDHDLGEVDFIFAKFIELLPKMKDDDIKAISYILENIENRYD